MQLSSPLFVLLAIVPIIASLLLGAQLKPEYLRDVVQRPRPLAVGLAGQFLILPALAAAFFYAYPSQHDFKWAWFILAAVPGGAISNMVTFLGHGRLSLSVMLTASSTLAGMITIPFWVGVGMNLLGDDAQRPLPIASMVIGSFGLLVIPVTIGITIGFVKPSLAERIRQPTRWTMLVMLLVAAVSYTAQRWDSIAADFNPPLFAGAAAFHVTAVLASWSLGRAFRLDRCDSFTVGMEVGVQNIVIALLVVELLNRPDLVPFIGYYTLIMILLQLGWIPVLGPRAPAAVRMKGIV